jgi:hypothetical protein
MKRMEKKLMEINSTLDSAELLQSYMFILNRTTGVYNVVSRLQLVCRLENAEPLVTDVFRLNLATTFLYKLFLAQSSSAV